MKLDRVIFASDLNANYIQFWPLTARVWAHLTGARPTLFLVAPPGTPIEKPPGSDVIEVVPPPDLETCFVAQTLRLLAPALFPKEVCIVSDIDMLVLRSDYVDRYIRNAPQDHLVIMNRYPEDIGRRSMCYHIGLGSTFADVLGIPKGRQSLSGWFDILRSWRDNRHGDWATDEQVLNEAVDSWAQLPENSSRLNVHYVPNVWKHNKFCISHYVGFKYDPRKASSYLEMEPPYPYVRHKDAIHRILRDLIPSLDLSQVQIQQAGETRPNRHPHKKPGGLEPIRTKRSLTRVSNKNHLRSVLYRHTRIMPIEQARRRL